MFKEDGRKAITKNSVSSPQYVTVWRPRRSNKFITVDSMEAFKKYG